MIRSEQSPDISNHDGSTVASEGVLQEPGEFAVAIGNMHQLALCNQQEKNKQPGRDTHSRHMQSCSSCVLVTKQQTTYLVISESIDTVPQGQQ